MHLASPIHSSRVGRYSTYYTDCSDITLKDCNCTEVHAVAAALQYLVLSMTCHTLAYTRQIDWARRRGVNYERSPSRTFTKGKRYPYLPSMAYTALGELLEDKKVVQSAMYPATR